MHTLLFAYISRSGLCVQVPELPMVADDSMESIKSTKGAVDFLAKIGADDDVERCASSRKVVHPSSFSVYGLTFSDWQKYRMLIMSSAAR